MKLLSMIFCSLLFMMSLTMVIFFNAHYLLILLMLEIILLSIFMNVCWNFLSFFSIMGMFVFLLVMVCMGGFSISLLVSLARQMGQDFWIFKFIF